MNHVTILGNLTSDSVLLNSKNGKPYLKFRMAISHKQHVTFVNIVAFGEKANKWAQYLKKGKRVLVNGRLDRSVIATNIKFLS